jgi:hypothetical protein
LEYPQKNEVYPEEFRTRISSPEGRENLRDPFWDMGKQQICVGWKRKKMSFEPANLLAGVQ